ncbi:sigma 54-interacting transcriptional regulator [uncultured Desulfosarcina sp.]|uniref:sigma-54 interaction domain-containing protein n=1 Tax=uncultured Desulfosarcina sp. TaxID=218289 RepID=UPI0029C75A7F|nr:sigma 54-interacting transcriptional regulator [uncultured Desulfosarcina sp.]
MVERLQFESFMARLSLGFVNMPLHQMQPEIQKGLKETALLFGFTWAVLIKGGLYKKSFDLRHADCAEDTSTGERIASLVRSPWYLKASIRKDRISITRLPDELPAAMTAEKETCREAGIVSIIGLPLQDDRAKPSFIAFCAAHPVTIDASEEGKRLERISQLFTSALIRQTTALQFDELFRFERLLSEISSTFSGVSAEEVDRTIEFGLERISTFLRADYCNLVPFSKTERSHNIVHSWVRKGAPPLPKFTVPLGDLFPWFAEKFKHRQVVYFSRSEELPDEASADRAEFNRMGTKSHVSVPITVGRTVVAVLSVGTICIHRSWSEELVQRLRLIGEIFANAIVRKQKQMEIQTAFSEIEKLNTQLEAECTYLRQEIELSSNFHNMIGQSEALKNVIYSIGQIASTDVTVLIHGETGTGKELVARAIHAASPRKNRPMVKVNCASLPANLIESELFGYEKGAFTNAHKRQIGRFELAHGSTLFLDEIGELPMESQAKLLRVLQEGEFERLGSAKTIKVDVRIIVATNRDLEKEMQKGRFRKDLWYRLNVFPIGVPPLRQRSEDIPLLVSWFILKSGKKLGKTIERVPTKVMKALQHFDWPGNVRELENVIERAVINSPHGSLQLLDTLESPQGRSLKSEERQTLKEMERTYIVQTIEETNGRIEGPTGAAVILGLHPSTLRSKMRKLGIQISAFVE